MSTKVMEMRVQLEDSQKAVLNTFRRLGPASNADIARHVPLTHPAVAQIVKRLCQLGYLEQARDKRKLPRGQPATIYHISDKNVFAGIHVGRKRLEFVALGTTGRILAYAEHGFGILDEDELAANSQTELERFLSSPSLVGSNIVGVGISTPYFWSGWRSILPKKHATERSWNSKDAADLFAFQGGVPVFVENDASSGALGELTFGTGATFKDFLYINIGTFIGGGLVLDGTLRTGAHGNSAALGPFPVSPSDLSGPPEPPRPFAQLLSRASLNALAEHARRRGAELDLKAMDDLAPNELPEFVGEWARDCAEALAQFLIGAWSLVDIEAVVLDGAVSKSLLKRVADETHKCVTAYQVEGIIPCELHLGKLGAMAQCVGAACLPMLELLGPPPTGGASTTD